MNLPSRPKRRFIDRWQVYQTHVAALVFDPQKDDVFETLRQWDCDLPLCLCWPVNRLKDEIISSRTSPVTGQLDAPKILARKPRRYGTPTQNQI